MSLPKNDARLAISSALARRLLSLAGLGTVTFLFLSFLLLSPVASVQAQDTFTHPRMEATREIFQRLVNALQDEFPVVSQATLHFVDLEIANAWVNQNAEVYVTRGLMDLLKTDDQMAGVLAHELAHVTQQHVPQQIRRNLEWSLLVLALSLAADRSGPYDNQVLSVLHPLVMYGYSREAELEADEVGMAHAIRAGYDPMGLVEALELITADSAVLPQHQLWLTHPLPEQRLLALRQRIDPRMGIPQRQVSWGRAPRSQYENPVDAATAFIQATYTEPDTLPMRMASGSRTHLAALQNLYPSWPDQFAVRPLGVVIEHETRNLLDYTVTGHLELATPLGTTRGPSLSLRLKPAASGWQVDDVTILGFPEADSPTALNPASLRPDPGGRAYLQALRAALQQGDANLLPPAREASDGAYHHMVEAVHRLLENGFKVSLHAIRTRELTAEERSLWSNVAEASAATYLELDLSWRLTSPQGHEASSRQRLWVAIVSEGGPWHTVGTRLVSL